MSECGNPPRLSSDERQAARSALHRALFGTELGVHFGRLMRELDACAAELADTKAMLARGVEFVEEDAEARGRAACEARCQTELRAACTWDFEGRGEWGYSMDEAIEHVEELGYTCLTDYLKRIRSALEVVEKPSPPSASSAPEPENKA
jgi:hypothetical protein